MQIPGTERPEHKAIDKAAAAYIEIRDERMALTEKEVDARAVLAAKMHEHGLTSYRYDDYLVQLETGDEKVKVKKVDGDAD
jgi:hypothetical protein